jgi:hypothetical protein
VQVRLAPGEDRGEFDAELVRDLVQGAHGDVLIAALIRGVDERGDAEFLGGLLEAEPRDLAQVANARGDLLQLV